MSDLDKARVWADFTAGLAYLKSEEIQAAVDVIQSLPDQWVDVEKVREIIADMDLCLKMETTSDFSEGIDNATTSWRDALKALITLKLPTLADMTQEERKACQWMQAKIHGLSDLVGVIFLLEHGRAKIMLRDGTFWTQDDDEVTPLPDLPKLQWPGGVVDCETVGETPTDQQPNSSETPKSSINPADVPPNEPWLIEVDGQKAIGARRKYDGVIPWSVAALDGSFAYDYHDNEITLIHKLVPETHALPEGVRLADHQEYGRVVVSPEDDLDGDYLAFYSDKNLEYGGSWAYPKEYELTFLDGEA